MDRPWPRRKKERDCLKAVPLCGAQQYAQSVNEKDFFTTLASLDRMVFPRTVLPAETTGE
jgi:hypothetical protein